MTRTRQLCYNPIIEPRSHPLPSRYQNQDSVFARAFDILRAAIDQRAFPAACAAVTFGGQLVCLKSFGLLTYDAESASATPDTIFDLASLTKPIGTTTMAMILYDRGLLDLDLPVTSVVFEFLKDDPRREAVTFRMLLAHSSGLPAYEKLYLETTSKDELLAKAFATPLVADPGSRAEYSDIGFIILGVALERIARQGNDGDTLDHFCHREIFGPLGMVRTAFKPPLTWHPRCAPTQDDQSFRLRIIQGEVQDENASVLGGVAGHAGLFASAPDVSLFAETMLAGGRRIVRPETIALFTRREVSPPGTSRALGWDTPSSPSQSGKYFSAASYGHLGYTGTSLWIDPQRQLSVTLLTNRTWPDCSNQAIKEIRPAFHDAVLEALEQNR
ncbi:MAG TPA: serine hydrolase domain-containing protein [Terriglobales bacterium]